MSVSQRAILLASGLALLGIPFAWFGWLFSANQDGGNMSVLFVMSGIGLAFGVFFIGIAGHYMGRIITTTFGYGICAAALSLTAGALSFLPFHKASFFGTWGIMTWFTALFLVYLARVARAEMQTEKKHELPEKRALRIQSAQRDHQLYKQTSIILGASGLTMLILGIIW